MVVVAILAVGGFAATTACAAGWSQQQALIVSNPASSDHLGYSVYISSDGGTALVGAYNKNGDTGTAYVFNRTGTGWTQQQQLVASDGVMGDQFGASVSLSGDGSTALVSANRKNSSTGAAYVFIRTGTNWTQQQELTAGDPASGDSFGYSVALSGNGTTALISAAGKNSSTGAAYVFIMTGGSWTQQQKLTASDAVTGDGLGYAISISLNGDGSTALLGARLKNSGAGVAYVFSRTGTTWTQQQELTPSDAAAGNDFGLSASLSGDGNIALVSADNPATGEAFVFTRSGTTWSQQQRLAPGDGANGDHFGNSVSLSGDGATALVGSYTNNSGAGAGSGAAYVYSHGGGTWNQQQKLVASDAMSGDNFGFSVSLSGDGGTAVVGAQSKNASAGAAYVFTQSLPATAVPEGPWVPAMALAGAAALVGIPAARRRWRHNTAGPDVN